MGSFPVHNDSAAGRLAGLVSEIPFRCEYALGNVDIKFGHIGELLSFSGGHEHYDVQVETQDQYCCGSSQVQSPPTSSVKRCVVLLLVVINLIKLSLIHVLPPRF